MLSRVALADVVDVALRAHDAELLLRREVVVLALAGHLHQRHAVPAGVRDALDVDQDHRAPGLRNLGLFERAALDQLVEARIARLDDGSAPVQAQDPRRALERAEHHDDPAVLAQVGDRLGAAAGEVEIGDLVRAEHPQGPDRALRRDVHPPVGSERRRCRRSTWAERRSSRAGDRRSSSKILATQPRVPTSRAGPAIRSRPLLFRTKGPSEWP